MDNCDVDKLVRTKMKSAKFSSFLNIPKLFCSLLFVIQPVILMAQDVPFFDKNQDYNDPAFKRNLYESSRGSYISDQNQSSKNVNPNSLSKNYSHEFSFIKTMYMLHTQIMRNSGRHYIYLDLTDQQFLLLDGYIEELLKSVETYQSFKLSNICSFFESFNKGNAADVYEQYILSMTTVDENEISAIDNFISTVNDQMGVDVTRQINLLVDKFSNSASYSVKVGIPDIPGINMTKTQYMENTCG